MAGGVAVARVIRVRQLEAERPGLPVGLAGFHGLPIDPHEREELFLTASQSFFAWRCW